MTDTPLSFHGDPALKAEVVARMRAHRDADTIIRGHYQSRNPHAATRYQGCFLGCALPLMSKSDCRDWHLEFSERYGVPETLAFLAEFVFERMGSRSRHDAHAEFAVKVLDVMPVGRDLEWVISPMIVGILTNPDLKLSFSDVEPGIPGFDASCLDGDGADTARTVEALIGLHRRRMAGDEPAAEEWTLLAGAAQEGEARFAVWDSCYVPSTSMEMSSILENLMGLSTLPEADFCLIVADMLVETLRQIGDNLP